MPETLWFPGDRLGWRGSWRTTYAPNLRLLVAALSEEQWVGMAKGLKTRPPMPWLAVNKMADEDLRALYHPIRELGPAGQRRLPTCRRTGSRRPPTPSSRRLPGSAPFHLAYRGLAGAGTPPLAAAAPVPWFTMHRTRAVPAPGPSPRRRAAAPVTRLDRPD